MAYLIARKRESHGCLALKIKHGENLVELKRRLNKAVGCRVCSISIYRHGAGV